MREVEKEKELLERAMMREREERERVEEIKREREVERAIRKAQEGGRKEESETLNVRK